ncbi:hypothetical protein JCM10908_001908 [Rhodotorula pacifica]|uniref:decapping nuclease n=1 Tax=Rhodotorula pacifica TaxID=1495444 RepID=UPI00316E6DBA
MGEGPPRKRPRVSPPPPPLPALLTPTEAPLAPPAAATQAVTWTAAPSRARPDHPPTPAATHPIHPAAYYSSLPPPAFQQPLHLTSFSYSPTRQLLLSDKEKDSSLSYYREPRLGSDLNRGFEHVVWRDGSVDEGLDALLEALDTWARKDPTGTAAVDSLLAKTALITWRGMLTKLMLAVYECENVATLGRRADGWEMNAMLVDDCLYLEESNPPSKLASKSASEQSGSNALPSYYGYSFESYCTTSPSVASSCEDDFSIPNTNVQWCSVVKTSLGGMRTIVGGEVDCVQPRPGAALETRDFVELKTNLVIQNQRDEINFERHKLLKHYVQSFLLGVPTVTVGFRTRQGVLAGLQSFQTLEIPRLVRGKPHAWDPKACLASAESLLSFIRQTLASQLSSAASPFDPVATPTANAEHPVFRITFAPSSSSSSAGSPGLGISIRQLTRHEIEEEVLAGKQTLEEEGGRVGFLPRKWVEAVYERRERINAAAAAGAGTAAGTGTVQGDGKGLAGETNGLVARVLDSHYPLSFEVFEGPVSSTTSAAARAGARARPVPPPPPPPPALAGPLPPADYSPIAENAPPQVQQAQAQAAKPTGVAALLKR